MEKIETSFELTAAIRSLEIKQAADWKILHNQLLITYEQLKPVNFIKESFNRITSAPDFQGNLLDTTLGLAAGYLSKKVIVGASNNPLKSLFGGFLQMGVSNIVLKNASAIKSTVSHLLNNFLKKKNDTAQSV